MTVEVFNKIAKASGEGMPLFRHKTQLEFFKSKEANYLKEMTKFQTMMAATQSVRPLPTPSS